MSRPHSCPPTLKQAIPPAIALSLLSSGALLAQQEPADDTSPPAEPEAAQEQEQEEPVDTIVIARKREEVLEDVPQSISVFTGEDLEQAGIRTVRDASYLVPNMIVTEFTSRRLSFPFIRGIGSGVGESSVVTYIDGVPQLTTGSTNLPLFDLDRVEILRGPQGTLYGRNALGGVIHLISEGPSTDPRWTFGGTAGNFDLTEIQLSYAGPLVGDTALNVSAMHSSREGYNTNDFTGNRVDSRDGTFGRAQLFIQPDQRHQWRVGIYGERARDGGFALNFTDQLRANPYHVNVNFEGEVDRDIISPSLRYDFLGDAVDFTSITAVTDWDVRETSDFDFTPIDLARRETKEAQSYVYQEFRVSSTEDNGPRLSEDASLRWLVGLSAFGSDTSASTATLLPMGLPFPPVPPSIDTNTGDFDDLGIGLFGDVAATWNEKLELSFGLRYDYESKQAALDHVFEIIGVGAFPDATQNFEEDFDQLLPKLSASYRFTPANMLYGFIAKGYKAGGFNLDPPPGQQAFEPETSWTFETGFKQSWLDERVNLKLAAFYIDWQDMQLSLFDPATQNGFVANAGNSTSTGVELELSTQPLDGLSVFGTYGYVDAEFDDFVDTAGQNFAGNTLPFAPDQTWSLGAQYGAGSRDEFHWYLRGEWVGVGTFYYDPSNDEGEQYQLANFRGGIAKGDFEFDLWVRNAFDEDYIPVAFQFFPGSYVGENGVPRIYGATLRVSF